MVSGPTAVTHTAVMMRRLNAADPTIVEGPSSPGALPRVWPVSTMASMISGAEDPTAMRLRLATVGFHTLIMAVLPSPSFTFFSELVITSTAVMKMSEMMAMPKNIYTMPRKYTVARTPLFQVFVPGI